MVDELKMTEWKIVGSTRKEEERKIILSKYIGDKGVIIRPRELRGSKEDEPGQFILQCELKTSVGWKKCSLAIGDYRLYELLLKVKWRPGPLLISREPSDFDREYYISKPKKNG